MEPPRVRESAETSIQVSTVVHLKDDCSAWDLMCVALNGSLAGQDTLNVFRAIHEFCSFSADCFQLLSAKCYLLSRSGKRCLLLACCRCWLRRCQVSINAELGAPLLRSYLTGGWEFKSAFCTRTVRIENVRCCRKRQYVCITRDNGQFLSESRTSAPVCVHTKGLSEQQGHCLGSKCAH